ncbi:DUF3606 domain-containing protein [Sphingomonas sp. NIBR02145]|uniref:DUF3606 domain-containing protein n=1 Tax=Sphingomonas sp. NIBR02145 TaxID=3014784 RepID=UPI0022B301E4|nr:DUF3606 domain-containing protein [Sphingomonas sp. NIBR02145]WHU04388.1 DUF3606 domain-containing protein [Sphingomonas sp. NIBR02145]
MSDRNPAHGGPATPERAAQESEQAGVADEGAAYSNAIERDAAGGANESGDKNGTGGTAARNPAIGAGTAGDPGIADRKATTIDLNDSAAAQRWADRYSVTRAQLEEAVSAVGSDAHAVQTYLRGQGGGD